MTFSLAFLYEIVDKLEEMQWNQLIRSKNYNYYSHKFTQFDTIFDHS